MWYDNEHLGHLILLLGTLAPAVLIVCYFIA
jgi:hypothetical protein